MKHLYILDLDNTLIYATGRENLPARVLLDYSDYTIYQRPYADELVQVCQNLGDVVVFTTAVRDYAEKVCARLRLKPLKIYSREDCGVVNDRYVKAVPEQYLGDYDSITIIDDMPEIWDRDLPGNCRFISISPFIGQEDDELLQVIGKYLH